MVVKIGDFGMSRDVYSTDYYKVQVIELILKGHAQLFSVNIYIKKIKKNSILAKPSFL